jgi:hypothetical protein
MIKEYIKNVPIGTGIIYHGNIPAVVIARPDILQRLKSLGSFGTVVSFLEEIILFEHIK